MDDFSDYFRKVLILLGALLIIVPIVWLSMGGYETKRGFKITGIWAKALTVILVIIGIGLILHGLNLFSPA